MELDSDISKDLEIQGMEFDIFGVETQDTEDSGNIKKIISKYSVSNSKYKEVWRRAWMKIKFKSLLLGEIKDLMLEKSNPDIKTNQITNLRKLLKHVGTTEDYTDIEYMKDHLIHPNSLFKNIWNSVLSVLLIYTLVVMPLSICFFESNSEDAWFVVDITIDFLFFLDILVNFNSAYYDTNGILISNRKTITLKYLKSWFLIDIISSIPFSLISDNKNNAGTLLRVSKLPRLAKLLKLSSLVKLLRIHNSNGMFSRITDKFNIRTSTVRVLKTFLSVLIASHIMACLWYYSAKFQDFAPDTWVLKFGYLDLDVGSLYLRSIYFIITTLSTVGYGDIYPVNDLERILAAVWIIFVMFFMSFTIGSMSGMMSSIDTKEKVLRYKISVIEEFCKDCKLNKELKFKLKQALIYSTEKHGGSLYKKEEIIFQLPKELRFKVAMAMHKGYASRIKIFTDLIKIDRVFVSSIIPLLVSQKFLTQDFIYKKGEHPDELFFIVKGRIGYSDNLLFQQKFDGDYFGDIELFIPSKRLFNTVAQVSTELFTIKKSIFLELLKKFPQIEKSLKESSNIEKYKSIRNMIEIKTIIELKRKADPSLNLSSLRDTIEKRFIEYQRYLKHNERNDISSSDLLLITDNFKEKLRGIMSLHSELNKLIIPLQDRLKLTIKDNI
jgi:CRP-like cAMP-binding protein